MLVDPLRAARRNKFSLARGVAFQEDFAPDQAGNAQIIGVDAKRAEHFPDGDRPDGLKKIAKCFSIHRHPARPNGRERLLQALPG